MFRGPQILTWSCPLRPLLLGVRDTHLPACSADTGASGCHYDSTPKKRRAGGISGRSGGKEEPSLSNNTICYSPVPPLLGLDYDNFWAREDSPRNLSHKPPLFSCHQLLQMSASAKPKLVEELPKNPEALSTYQDCLTRTTITTGAAGLKPQRRHWDIGQLSLGFNNETKCNLLRSHSLHMPQFNRPFSSLTHATWILNHFHSRFLPCCLSFHQIRAFHSAPCEVNTLRDCLSLDNEERCRHSLRPNLKLYEVDKGKRGAVQSDGKGHGRWASVLVSLCSVEGEPAFLFTLRSSTLKGRHKGDVSFAGGKSDPSDMNVVATALREAQEELGLNVATERVWGILKPLRDTSGMMIAPVLANLGPLESLSFKPNPAEVEEIFTIPLSHLCNPLNRGYTHFRVGDKYGYTLPVFCNGKHKVWGLTAVALDHTLKLIVPR